MRVLNFIMSMDDQSSDLIDSLFDLEPSYKFNVPVSTFFFFNGQLSAKLDSEYILPNYVVKHNKWVNLF